MRYSPILLSNSGWEFVYDSMSRRLDAKSSPLSTGPAESPFHPAVPEQGATMVPSGALPLTKNEYAFLIFLLEVGSELGLEDRIPIPLAKFVWRESVGEGADEAMRDFLRRGFLTFDPVSDNYTVQDAKLPTDDAKLPGEQTLVFRSDAHTDVALVWMDGGASALVHGAIADLLDSVSSALPTASDEGTGEDTEDEEDPDTQDVELPSDFIIELTLETKQRILVDLDALEGAHDPMAERTDRFVPAWLFRKVFERHLPDTDPYRLSLVRARMRKDGYLEARRTKSANSKVWHTTEAGRQEAARTGFVPTFSPEDLTRLIREERERERRPSMQPGLPPKLLALADHWHLERELGRRLGKPEGVPLPTGLSLTAIRKHCPNSTTSHRQNWKASGHLEGLSARGIDGRSKVWTTTEDGRNLVIRSRAKHTLSPEETERLLSEVVNYVPQEGGQGSARATRPAPSPPSSPDGTLDGDIESVIVGLESEIRELQDKLEVKRGRLGVLKRVSDRLKGGGDAQE